MVKALTAPLWDSYGVATGNGSGEGTSEMYFKFPGRNQTHDLDNACHWWMWLFPLQWTCLLSFVVFCKEIPIHNWLCLQWHQANINCNTRIWLLCKGREICFLQGTFNLRKKWCLLAIARTVWQFSSNSSFVKLHSYTLLGAVPSQTI